MTGTSLALQRLLDRLARLHPADAAAIIAELPAGQRTLVVERLRVGRPEAEVTYPAGIAVDLSPWLLGLQHPASVLTPHARDALTRHIQAVTLQDERRATPFALVVATLKQWWSGSTQEAAQP